MKILGIVLPILLSSFTITHGKKKLGLSKGTSSDSGASILAYCDSSLSHDLHHASSNCEDPVAYKTVPAIAVPASSVGYSAVPAGSVGCSACSAGGSMSLSKKGKKGSGLSYEHVLGSLGKGLSGSFDKKGKGHHGCGVSGTPVVYSANVQPVQYVVPVQPSYPQDDCYDSVPSVVPVSYKSVGPVNYDAVPIGPSISYQKPVDCETVPIGPSISYPHNVGSVAYSAVPIGASISYPHNVGAVAYRVPVRTPVSYQNSVGHVAYGAVPVGPSVSYQKSVGPVSIGHASNCAPTYVTSSYSEVGSPVVGVSSGHQPSHNKLGLLAGMKHKPVGYYGPPPRVVPAYAPPSEGSYVIVSSGNSQHSYGHGYDC